MSAEHYSIRHTVPSVKIVEDPWVGRGDQFWVSKRDLGNSTLLPKGTLIKKMQELAEAGLVETSAGLDEVHGGHKPTLYRLTC